jgi:hypothetical protein
MSVGTGFALGVFGLMFVFSASVAAVVAVDAFRDRRARRRLARHEALAVHVADEIRELERWLTL